MVGWGRAFLQRTNALPAFECDSIEFRLQSGGVLGVVGGVSRGGPFPSPRLSFCGHVKRGNFILVGLDQVGHCVGVVGYRCNRVADIGDAA